MPTMCITEIDTKDVKGRYKIIFPQGTKSLVKAYSYKTILKKEKHKKRLLRNQSTENLRLPLQGF